MAAEISTRYDAPWVEACARLGVGLARGGPDFVHYDGRTLHIADDEHLDDDDTVAQIVLHELCHAVVQGPARFREIDWGLDNTTNDDDDVELAAVRLQAHLLGAWGLRGVLYPTTVWKPFYLSLGPDALAGDDASARFARESAERAARPPYGDVLAAALDETARLADVPRGARTGLARDPHGRVCGDCAFRSPGGRCRKAARRVAVAVDAPACARFERDLDCLSCGACCRAAYDVVLVGRRERVVELHPERLVVRDGQHELAREGARCASLEGPDGGPFACAIYDDRPRTCRDFERGGRHCLTARRRVGLSF